MSGGGAGGKGAAAPVPAGSRKLVQGLKEIVNRPEAEIYAALRECGMDPDEAVSRLLSQDTFQEVKSKRDKKKEIKEVPETRYRSANSSTNRGLRSGADRGGRSNSVHSSSTDNMTSRPPVSGSGMASVNSSQRQTIASSSANKHMVTDGPAVSLQSSSGFQHGGWSGTPGQLSMADIVKMGRPQGKASSKPVVTADRGYAGQYPSLPSTNQNLKQSVSMVPPTELDKGLQPAQDSVQVKNHGHSAADSKLPYGTDWSPQDDPTSANQSSLPETSGDLYEASFQSSTLVTDVVSSHENSHLDENSTFAMRSAPASERHLEPSDGISEYNDGMLNNSSSYQPHNYSYTEQEVEDSSADVSAAAAANFQSLSLHNDELAAKKTAEDNPAVIIPDHLQVTETERVSLSFGSFGSGAFSGLLPRKATDRNVEFPAREESAPVDQLDARNQDYYESGAVTSQADENLEAMLGANMENVDAPSVSEANELRQDVLDPSGLQYYVPSVSSHAYSNTNASQPSTMGDPQGNNQAHTRSHLSNLMIEEVPERKIIWDQSRTSLFIHICFQEISQGNMEVGELSDKACETIRQRLFKEGMKCTKSQIRYKWDEVKRLHSFYHNKVLGAKVEVKDEKFWKRILKSRISKKEYKDLIHGPPKDLEHLDFIFGNKIAVESYEKENQERESAESSRDVLTVDLERVTHDAKRFSEQLKMAEDTNKRLQECNSSLQQQNSNLQADASKSGETISKLQKEKSAMMETMAIMRESNSSMGNQLESYRETCNKQQEQIRIFQKQLAVVTKKLKLADVTAIEAMTGYEKQKEKIKYLEERLAQAECQIVEGDKLRKKLHNTILELKGNIRVFCRVRPLLRFDGDSNGPEGASISFPTSVEFAGCGIDLINQGQKLSFSYDKVFDHDASQEDVFVEISQLVQSALDGYKVCIFAYGQTGSGKTYTMMGKPGIDQKGIIPRSLEQIFKTSRFLESQGWNYSMQASMLEIYNETIRDLLTPGRSNSFEMTSNKQYTIKHDPHGNTTVSELTIIDVFGIADVTSLLERASQSRSVGRTQMNEQSSRSHFVFTLKISGSNENTGQHVQGVLNLIDLAGSERLAKSGSTGDRLKETQSINKSLSALSDVIFAIAKGDDHVPFRNSKLTYLLQPCLGGDSKALMFVNISPEASSVGETICSLRFASRVNACEIGIPRR